MSNKGSEAFYRVTEKIKEFLLNSPDVKTVTYGDITQVDLNKQDMFPLSHIIVNNATLNAGVIQFNITVMSMDLVWQSKTNPSATDFDIMFYKLDNEQDVLNTQLKVVNLLNQSMLRKTLRGDNFELVGDSGNCEPFHERFENVLAGWAYTFDVFVENNIDTCQN
tara:strand:+ start:1642 stop:2136 length:495 start_codon:yes stop_codon:yes gene_type:complete